MSDQDKVVDVISAPSWSKMSLEQLLEQKTVLQQRLFKAYDLGKPELAVAIQQGIDRIDAILNQRTDLEPHIK